jgi:hypothetical protein
VVSEEWLVKSGQWTVVSCTLRVVSPASYLGRLRKNNLFREPFAMITECCECGEIVGKPVATSGCAIFFPASAITGLVMGIGMNWSSWVLLSALPLWLFLSWIFDQLPIWLTMFDRCFRRCPKCGSRKWSKPRYSGFGL